MRKEELRLFPQLYGKFDVCVRWRDLKNYRSLYSKLVSCGYCLNWKVARKKGVKCREVMQIQMFNAKIAISAPEEEVKF